jgi:hypothetical protein
MALRELLDVDASSTRSESINVGVLTLANMCNRVLAFA